MTLGVIVESKSAYQIGRLCYASDKCACQRLTKQTSQVVSLCCSSIVIVSYARH